ncbi:hypothetical protein [Pseudomonas fluorescens]|uniref:hypothetical protein n=1 Tax=Pseudomonas fluorescens TaxID=294 RepID=UPI0012B8D033|nr:hypothetical protein [Pseudomonas fluorescens]
MLNTLDRYGARRATEPSYGQRLNTCLRSTQSIKLGQFSALNVWYGPEIPGDSGVAGKVEFQYNRLRRIKDFVLPTQYYSYWDIGKVWSEEPRYVGSENLSSAGVGAHFQVLKDLFISPEVAFPLTRSVSA